MNLKYLTDRSLLLDTKALAQEYRKVTTELLHHLREIEKRRLFSDLGYKSLFDYVVQELGFSEGSAARRIKAARLLEEIPEMEEKITSGTLTLSNIALAADAFKKTDLNQDFKRDILTTIENTSARLCEKTLLEITGAKKIPKQTVKPLTPTTTLLSITLSDEEMKLYEELKALIQTNFWKTVFEFSRIEHERRRFKIETFKTGLKSSSRYVPTALKKAIYERDKSCKICGSKYKLEYDHIKPYSMGGKTEYTNLRLLCRSCNQRQKIKQKL